ncbi:MAG: precorrin-3B C(17)-methyltransferase, partial [Clostridia bacterium]|nr:precorrin-3B C(17)-methyltransferase [Clostridia bacterium]
MKKLYVIGIGPGEMGGMTENAGRALQESQVIIGYKKYVELVRPYFQDKEYVDSNML